MTLTTPVRTHLDDDPIPQPEVETPNRLLILDAGADPQTPGDGQIAIYLRDDNTLVYRDADGAEHGFGESGASVSWTKPSVHPSGATNLWGGLNFSYLFDGTQTWTQYEAGGGQHAWGYSGEYQKFAINGLRYYMQTAGVNTIASIYAPLIDPKSKILGGTDACDLTGKDLNLLVYALDDRFGADGGGMNCQIRLGSGANGVNKSRCHGLISNSLPGIRLQKGLNNIRMHQSGFITHEGSGVDWAAVNRIEISLATTSTYVANRYIEFLGLCAGVTAGPQFCIALEGGYATHWNKTLIFNNFGIKVTLFPSPNKVGTTGYLTLNQLHALHDMGNAICINDDPTNSFAVDPTRIDYCRAWMINNGFSDGADYIKWPNGAFNQASLDYAQNIGIKLGLGISLGAPASGMLAQGGNSWGVASGVGLLNPYCAYGISNPLVIPRQSGLSKTLANFQSMIDGAILTQGLLIITSAETSISDQMCNDVASYVAGKVTAGQLDTIGFPEIYALTRDGCKKSTAL